MSKIYEALRQAELDRARNGSAQSDSNSNSTATAQALLEKEQERNFSSTIRSAVSMPVSGMNGTDRLAAEVPVAKGVLIDMLPEAGDSAAFAVTQSRPVVWNPVLAQLPALEARGSAVEQFRSLRSRMQEFRDLNKLKTLRKGPD